MSTKLVGQTPLITLIGPPNSGKTSVFNLLSGKNYKTVNYPGSTVEYFTCSLASKFNIQAEVIDSPGIISLNADSPDEKVAVDTLLDLKENKNLQLIINTVDANQLSRHLLLTKQLIDSGFKVILVLTMKDLLGRKKIELSEKKLSEELNCDVVSVNGRTGEGLSNLIKAVSCNLVELKNNGHLNKVEQTGKYSSEQIINYYGQIENIVKNVTVLNKKSEKPNLIKANKELVIINNNPDSDFNILDDVTLKIDRLLLHRFWGIIIFVLVMGLTFTSIFWLAQPLMELVDGLFSTLNNLTSQISSVTWLSKLISDGIISGTGAVMVFVPQIIILFLILGILEDTGYLARGAMIIDKPLSKIGLNGKSFVPMLSGFACAIPAMLAARTIPNKKERLLTIFIIPLMSCSARLPVFALLIAYLLPIEKIWLGGFILAAIYIFSISSSLIVAALVNKFSSRFIKTNDNSSFILELPSYRMPKLLNVLEHTYHSTKQYIYKAGPIILLFSVIIWFLSYFPDYNPKIESENLNKQEITDMQNIKRFENSYASDLGKLIQPAMTPLGMDWRVGVSLISAFAAREVFVSSMALIFNVTESDDDLGPSLLQSMNKAVIGNSDKKLFTTATIFGLIVFFIFALQCISTLAISRKETGSWRIPLLQFFVFGTIAYVMTFITVNGLRFLGVQ